MVFFHARHRLCDERFFTVLSITVYIDKKARFHVRPAKFKVNYSIGERDRPMTKKNKIEEHRYGNKIPLYKDSSPCFFCT